MQQTALTPEESWIPSAPHAIRARFGWARYLVAFLAVMFLLFLGSNRRLVVYDEGILLTNVMRVLAGQVIHRDFYYNYGPAQIYILAGLFKIFGPSVLIERLVGVAGDAFLVLTVFAITRKLTRPNVAISATMICFLWVFGIGVWSQLTAIILWSTWLLVRVFETDLPRKRAFAAGLLVGIATLNRYDMGVGSFACDVLIVAIAVTLRLSKPRAWLASIMRNLWPYILGVALPVLPLAWVYARAGVIHDLLFDIVIYTAKHYRAGRRLPFPRPQVAQLQELLVYVVAFAIIVGLYVAAHHLLQRRTTRPTGHAQDLLPRWIGLLIAFGIVATMLYVKGMVRVSAGQEAMSAMLCLVMMAVLFEHARTLRPGLRPLLKAVVVLSVFLTLWADLHPISAEHKFKSSMLLWLLVPGKMAPQPPFSGWCHDQTPATRGVCYLLDDDHIQAVEFLDAHTHPGDKIYVGLPEHDRVLENDNITYFAAQRLPATKWSHFDPFLQNSVPTQVEIVSDLERNAPPYIVLDSEFDALREPNGSSVHTGVHLLDDYIVGHYQPVKRFGEMTVLERR